MKKREYDPEQPMSAGRIEYLEQARERVRLRRLRRAAVIVLLLAAAVVFGTGILGSSLGAAKDMVDTVRIALLPEQGYPQKTGIQTVYQAEALSGGYVVLGQEGCLVYSENGHLLHSIQAGYGRPALAAGKDRFVLYNRAGKELRVASRTQTLYTKSYENSLYLCAISDGGRVAAVTSDPRYVAKLMVYSSTMEELLSWSISSSDGTPVRMAFSPGGSQLAVAALTARDGQVVTNLYLLDVSAGDPVLLASAASSMPQWLGWVSSRSILAVFDDHVSLFDLSGSELARRDYSGEQLASVSVDEKGLALLFGSGSSSRALITDLQLNTQYEGAVPAANRIVRGGESFYLLCDSSVERFTLAGEYQNSWPLEAKPQALLAGKRLLLLSGNTVQQLEIPTPES